MNMLRIIILAIITVAITGCTSLPVKDNYLTAMAPESISMLRFGDWTFTDDGYQYPFPVVVNPVIHYETHMEQDLQIISPLLRQLIQRSGSDFILMCGNLTEIAILDNNLHWVGQVSINADGRTITLVDNPLHPTKGITADSPEFAKAVFMFLYEHAPDAIQRKIENNPCLRDNFEKYINHAAEQAVPGYAAQGASSPEP